MDVRFDISGAVQGVGFRPFIWRAAREHGVLGEVYNDGEGVKILARADEISLLNFKNFILNNLPPLAKIDEIKEISQNFTQNFTDFKIVTSQNSKISNPILPDFAICDECKHEFYDVRDTRFKYPFINCTNCGPRLSIIRALPYDRANTTMSEFAMCEHCESEYRAPTNRRYHAEPISCHACGPRLALKNMQGEILERDENAIIMLAHALKRGEIACVKGLGGYHIMADATNSAAVRALRKRKNRPTKPFALMCRDEQMADKIAEISPSQRETLNSNIKPIVLLKKRKIAKFYVPKASKISKFKIFSTHAFAPFYLSSEVAPNTDKIGIFIAPTGVHLLLFEHFFAPLIATSANVYGEPIIYDERKLHAKMAGVASLYLDNDRKIIMPSDDSIVISRESFSNSFLRTSRGLNPRIFMSKHRAKGTFLALGAEMKNQFAIYRDGQIFISPYIGDMKNIATQARFFALLDMFVRTYDLHFDAVIADMHPHFAHTAHFTRSGAQMKFYQHHFAHLLSTAAQHGALQKYSKMLGFCFDGTGYGSDGEIWGGEIMLFSARGFVRVARFGDIGLIGGEKAIKNIYKIAIDLIYRYDLQNFATEFLAKFDERERANLAKLAPRAVRTSSLGRLFDAFACIITGLCATSFDGEAGIALEALYDESISGRYSFEITRSTRAHSELSSDEFSEISGVNDGEFCEIIDFKSALIGALRDDERTASTRFLRAICALICDYAMRFGLPVVLSGGVFANQTLLNLVARELGERGVEFFVAREIPANDSGIAYGQLEALLSEI